MQAGQLSKYLKGGAIWGFILFEVDLLLGRGVIPVGE